MRLPVIRKEFVSPSDFVGFWSRQYSYENEHRYNENIGKELTEERIWCLFLWKNGRPLSNKKLASVKEHYLDSGITIPEVPNPSFRCF